MSYPNRMTQAFRNAHAPASPPDLSVLISNATNGVAEVRIYDEIGAFGISGESFAQEIAGINAARINVRLNSPGGDVFDGMAIYRQLLDHPAQVHVQVDGIAASIASIIMLAGDSVEISQHGMVMIHDAFALTVGNAADMHQMGDTLDKMSDTLAGIYAARAGGDAVDWRARMRAETWLTATEARDLGLADTVGSDTADELVAAGFDWRMFRNAPERLVAANDTDLTPASDDTDEEQPSPISAWRISARHQLAEAELGGVI